MMGSVPRLSVDEPLVVQRVICPHTRGVTTLKSKLVVQRVREIDKLSTPRYNALNPKNLARRQAERGSSVSLEVSPCSTAF